MEKQIGTARLELIQGDITSLDTDAIVNAANSQLILGGGVAGAIRSKGGPTIQDECNRKSPIPVGAAVMTTAGNLPARHVIHAVGPRMGEGDEDKKLRNATLNSLQLAETANLRCVAFPAISTGIFGYPIDRCARIMLETAIEYIKHHQTIEHVIFCLFDRAGYDVFLTTLETLTADR